MRNPTFFKTRISIPIRFTKDQASQDIPPFVQRLLVFCVHDSKVRCLSVLCRAGYADSNLAKVRDVIKQRLYAYSSLMDA